MINKQKQFSTKKIYGEWPVWKLILRISAPWLLISFVNALFTFVDILLLINLLPLTNTYSFYNLFSVHSDIFRAFINNSFFLNKTNLSHFIDFLALQNHLHFYNTASIVRTATSLIMPISFMITSLPGWIATGGNVLFSQNLAKNKFISLVKVFQNTFYTSLLTTIIGMIILYFLNYFLLDYIAMHAVNKNIILSNYQSIYYYSIQHHDILNFYVYSVHKHQWYNNVKNVYLNNLPSNTKTLVISKQNIYAMFLAYYEQVKTYAIIWAQEFIVILTSFLFISSMLRIFVNLIRAYGKTSFVTIVITISVLINIFLDFVFIWIVQIGMMGAATATVIGWISEFIFVLIYFQRLHKKNIISLSFNDLKLTNFLLSWNVIKTIYGLSVAFFVNMIAFSITRVLIVNQLIIVCATLYPNLGGMYFVSIVGAVLPIMNLFRSTISGVGGSGTAIVAYAYGQKNFKRIHQAIWLLTLFIGLWGTFMFCLIALVSPINNFFLCLFHIPHAYGYTNAAFLYENAKKFLLISTIVIPFQGLAVAAKISFRVGKRYLSSIFIALAQFFVTIPLVFIFKEVAIHQLISIDQQYIKFSLINPIYNPNMWLFMWIYSAPIMIANLIVFSITIWFVYSKNGLQKPKKQFKQTKIGQKINQILLKKYLNSEWKI